MIQTSPHLGDSSSVSGSASPRLRRPHPHPHPFDSMPLSPNPGPGLDQRLGLGIALDVPVPSTPPRQRARSSSPPGKGGRSTSASPGIGSRFFPGQSTGSQTASPRPDQGYGSPNPGGYEPVGMSGGVKSVGKAVAGRMLRTVRRGNLPFLIVFVS